MSASSKTMEDTMRAMGAMSTEQLQEIIKRANTLTDERLNQRRKELWGNVVAAIRRYEQEIAEIELRGEIDCTIALDPDAVDTPGVLYVAY